MNVRLEHSARRILMAGGLAVALLVPTLACMGGGDSFDAVPIPDAPGEDAGEKPDEGSNDGGGEADAKAKLLGTWQVKPRPEDLRQLKVISIALRPNGTPQMVKKQLGSPPPTPEEVALFKDVQKLPADDPDRKFLQSMIQMMKDARLVVDQDKWHYTFGGDTVSMGWTVDDHSGDTMKVTLTGGPGGTEKHTLTFKGSDQVDVHITAPKEQHLVFARK